MAVFHGDVMPPPRGLVQQLDHQLHQNGLLPRGARVLVAVSGGADSVALLRLLAAINGSAHWGWKIAVGHVDHGIRGRESAADARFVRALARRLKVRCAVRKLKLSAGASEEAAREGRLAALRAMAGMRKGGRSAGGGRFDVVVTAHHADDQAETVLMRMMRGTGIEGLAGIAARAEVGGLRLVRPLLSIRRSALREYLASIGQGWREDRTNASARYLRNRVRQTLMPLVQVLWPRGVEALGRLAQLAGETQGFVDEEVERWMGKGALRAEKGKVSISREVLRSAPAAVASEIVRRAIGVAAGQRGEPVAVDFERVRELLRLAAGRAGGKRVQMGKGMTLQVLREEIVIPRREGRRGEESKG